MPVGFLVSYPFAMMKNTLFTPGFVLVACLLVFGHGFVHGANIWDGGSPDDSNWSTPENWDNNAVPSFPVGVTFDGTERLDPFNDLDGIRVNGITFGETAGAFVISGNGIVLGGNIVSQNLNSQTINLDMELFSTNTRTVSRSGGSVTLNGDISGGGALTTSGGDNGTLTINGNNSFTGGVTYVVNSSSVQTLNLGHANALGTGTFAWTVGSTGGSYLSNTSGAAMTIANKVSLSGQGMMSIGGSDDITFSGTVTNVFGHSTSGRRIFIEDRTITFGGDFFLSGSADNGFDLRLTGAGNLLIHGVVANYDGAGGTAGGIWHGGTGTISLLNESNTYTGANTFGEGANGTGIIVVTKLADGGQASSIGASSNAVDNITIKTNSKGIIRYIGDGDSTDRLFSFGGSNTLLVFESSGSGALHFTNTGAIAASGTGRKDLELSGDYTGSANTMAANIRSDTGTLHLAKSGAGTWELSNTSEYTGSTTVSGGTLRIVGTGSIDSTTGITVNGAGSVFDYTSSVALTRNVTLSGGGAFFHSGEENYSGTLTWTNGILGGTNWNGNLNNRTVNANRIISPGNSPGTAVTGSQTWGSNGAYIWEINDAAGTAGFDPGWDVVIGTGTLTISASSGSPFTIFVTSLDPDNNPGNAANFNASVSYMWLIADFNSDVVGFDPDAFLVDVSGFTNGILPGSTFSVVLGDFVPGGDASQIYLSYTAVPEPQTAALLVGAAGIAIALLRRRRKL